MPTTRDMALTVEERGEGLFFWVLLEACDTQASDALHYRARRTAATAQPSYSSALVLGMAELRRMAEAEGG
jgi:hypothetical protein